MVSQLKELCGLMAALALASMAFAWMALAAVPGTALAQPPAPQIGAQDGSQASAEERVAAIQDLVQAHHDIGQFEGVILVAEGDNILFHQAYGLANREWAIPATTATRFHTGSVGKQMTGAIILQLMEEGKIGLDQSIIDVLPDYPDVHGHKVKVRHLLNHTSGIPNYTRAPEFQTQSGNPISRAGLLALFQDAPLEFEPGASFSYTNSGFFLLSLMIETIEGEPYGDVLQRRLLTPLKLSDTGYMHPYGVIERMAHAYVFDGLEYKPEPHTDESWIVGNAMIHSTAQDLFHWTQALFAGEPFAKRSTRDFMLEIPDGKERNYSAGIGNVPLTLNGTAYRGAGHSGALGGFRATQSRAVEPAWTVIALSNIGVDQNDLADKVLKLLAGETVPLPSEPVSIAMRGKLNRLPMAGVKAWFDSVRASDTPLTRADEAAIDQLGFAFLDRGETEKAFFVLGLNAEAFPTSPFVFTALGAAYFHAGDKKRAREEFEKAQALDPDDANAKRGLAEIDR